MRIRPTVATGVAATLSAAAACVTLSVLPAQAQAAAPAAHSATSVPPPSVLCTTQLAATRKVARELHLSLGSFRSPLPSKALKNKVARQLNQVHLYPDATNVKKITGPKTDEFFVRRLTWGTWKILNDQGNCGRPVGGL